MKEVYSFYSEVNMKHMVAFYSCITDRLLFQMELTDEQYQLLKNDYDFEDEIGCFPTECFIEDYED